MRQLKITKQVTNREAQSLDKYLHEIGRVDLLTAEAEEDLARKIHAGDMQALDKLVKSNLRFVVSVAKQYQNQGLGLSDLINEGNLGLIKAAYRFDETKGFKFISYAVWWIRQTILQSLAEQARIVRLPLNKIGSINKITRTFSALEQRYERTPTHEEIAKELEIAPKDVHLALKSIHRHVSMDAPVNSEDESGTLYDLMESENSPSPDKSLMNDSLRQEIERLLQTLPDREGDILRMFYGLNGTQAHTLEEISDEFELTRERVRQIKEKAIKKLKNVSKSKLLKAYLG